MATTHKNKLLTTVCIVVVTLAFCGYIGGLLIAGAKEPAVKVLDDSLQIKGLYGLTVKLSDIAELALVEQSMEQNGIGRRVNGADLGQSLKGNFDSAEGRILVFVNRNSAPIIKITRVADKPIYISFKDSNATRRLYQDLQAQIRL